MLCYGQGREAFEPRWEQLAAFIGISVTELHVHADKTCDVPAVRERSYLDPSPVREFVQRLANDSAVLNEVLPLLYNCTQMPKSRVSKAHRPVARPFA